MSTIFLYTLIFFIVFLVLMLFAIREVRWHKENVQFNEHLKILRKRAMDKVLGKKEEEHGDTR